MAHSVIGGVAHQLIQLAAFDRIVTFRANVPAFDGYAH